MTMKTKILKLPAVSNKPIAEIRIGKTLRMSICGFTAQEIGTPLVEVNYSYLIGPLNLTVEQAEAIAAGLLAAAKQARG